MTPTTWIAPLLPLRSLGSQYKGDGTLAGLHEARAAHLGQFFTPLSVVHALWTLVQPAIAPIAAKRTVSIFDNSCGTGRMFAFANPEKFSLWGCDVHAPSVNALSECAALAGFNREFLASPMEETRAHGFDIALINPPFSIQLEGPTLEAFECNTFGRFGPDSSCVSDAYALAQALSAAQYVGAVLPRTFAKELAANPLWRERLALVAHLPAGSFRDEGTEVATSLAVWDALPTAEFIEVSLANLQDLPQIAFQKIGLPHLTPKMRRATIECDTPSITRPVTGDNTVRVCHQRRKIILGFKCGFTEARVKNAILGSSAVRYVKDGEHRQPSSLPFTGSARLSMDAYAMENDPEGALQSLLLDTIRSAGASPVIAPGFLEYFRKFCRRVKLTRTPFRHVIYQEGGMNAERGRARCNATLLLDPSKWASPMIPKGAEVAFSATSTSVEVSHKAGTWRGTKEDFARRFTIVSSEDNAGSWAVKFPGRVDSFPEIARSLQARMRKLGIDQWLYPYQQHDVIEMAMSPFGACGALSMGLGKARIAIALCLMSTARHSLICVEPHLVDEMVTELRKLPIDPSQWQTIASLDAARNPRRINVISYVRLRSPIARGVRTTYAKVLRGRIGLAIADEGHLLRNAQSDQSKALRTLGARRRFVLTGTPIANYPRNTLPILMWIYGEGTAVQSYGIQKPYLREGLVKSATWAVRGADKFREDFTTEEWCTNEYAEEMSEGAKREIPRIADIATYRSWIAPLIKRRTAQEPEVAAYVRIPTPTHHVHSLEFDEDHLHYYLEVSEEFRSHYLRFRAGEGNRGSLNLIALLARIGAVEAALNVPHRGRGGESVVRPFRGPPTSKYRKAIELCEKFTKQGRKTIIFTHSPDAAIQLGSMLRDAGIESVVLHGGVAQKDRTESLRDLFRMGEVPVLVATKGVARTGLNIPEASRVIFFDRAWTSSIEDQAAARVLRPQQRDSVEIHYLHLAGSLDEYQAQMVAHKRDAAAAGLDWLMPSMADQDFLHLDTILGRFVEGLGLRWQDRRRGLAFAA